MQIGDLVKTVTNRERICPAPGIITKIETWRDPGAPERNVGINIFVLWSNGYKMCHDEYELEIIYDN